MCDITKQYYQSENIKYIKTKYTSEVMVQVSGKKTINNSEVAFWCGLLPLEYVEKAYQSCNWDTYIGSQGPEFIQTGDNVEYRSRSFEFNNCENIVHYREFYGIKQNYVELCEEFRLINNLFYDVSTNSYLSILSNGECEDVAIIKNNTNLFIKLNYLTRYASAKQMALALFFEFQTRLSGTLEENNLQAFRKKGIKEGNIFYGLWGDEIRGNSPYTCSILRGKKILLPKPIETCGYWPYEKEKEYCEYIIGVDEYGENKTYTSNPNKLKNYFDKNSEAPHYLTPVFFDKKVLHKYIANQDLYSIGDGYVSCKGMWQMSIDNHHRSYVAAYLGDLGRDLPEKEQLHWKEYNIAVSEKISTVAFCRDFLCIPMASTASDLKFKNDFELFQQQWEKKYSWMLFLPLIDQDEYNFNRLHIPVLNTQEEFDFLVLSLVKVLIDSLNEKELSKQITVDENMKSIAKLERWLHDSNIAAYEEHIVFLKELQNLRSSGTGHRKGKNYEHLVNKFNITHDNYKDVFDSILIKADKFILFLSESFLHDTI